MSSSITSTKSSSSMRIRYSCSNDDSKNHGTPTDYLKDSVSKPGSPSSLNRIDLTLLFAIDLRNQKLQLRKICRNCRLSLPNNVLCIHRLDQVCRSRPQCVVQKKSQPISNPKSPFSITLAPRII